MGQAVRATVQGGICGFVTRIYAEGDDEYKVRLRVESDCEKVRAYVSAIGETGSNQQVGSRPMDDDSIVREVNALEEIGRRHDALSLAAARDRQHGACVGCVTAAGLYKAMQTAAGLALPADSRIEISLLPNTEDPGSR